jgi:hypothetical protein
VSRCGASRAKGDEDPAVAGPNRVPERDRSTMTVGAFGVDVELSEHREPLRRERLVELEQIDLAQVKCLRRAAPGGSPRKRLPQRPAPHEGANCDLLLI